MHYDRNIRLILFLVLPILGFLGGWSVNQKIVQNTAGGSVVRTEPEVPEKSLTDTASKLFPLTKKNSKPRDVDLSLFWETWNLLAAHYLDQDKINTKDQLYGATRGLVESLDDPYTIFMTPEETSKFEESISGEFEGIGAEVGVRNDQIVIVTPLKGSPAELAGVEAGDVILAVDEESTFGLAVSEVVMKIRGPRGEKVVLTLKKEDERDPVDITIVRDSILLEDLTWEMKDDVAVITITQFGTEVEREFKDAVSEILLQNPRGVVIDLRNNGGGLLDACVAIASSFFDQEILVRTRGRSFGSSGDIISDRGGLLVDMPLIVLVNKGSASASEIFAGAVKDHKRGILLGQKTFGKGSVQNVIPLTDGSSLKVTIAEWLTPLEHSINEQGIEPDEEILLTEEDVNEGRDPAMERALDLVGTDEMRNLMGQIAAQESVSSEEPEAETPTEGGEESSSGEEASSDVPEE